MTTAEADVDPTAADRTFTRLVDAVVDRYRGATLTARKFARGKLRGDGVYRSALFDQALPSGGTLLDVGCGQGLALATFAEARRLYAAGGWPVEWAPPPLFDWMVGVERRRRVAGIARQALAADAAIVDGDARTEPPGRPQVVLLFDVLHMMPSADQDALLGALAGSLAPGGVMLVREADASGGWGFRAVRLANRAKALALGSWRQRFHFRTAREWHECFARLGCRAAVRPMGEGTPFANVLFRVTADRHGRG